MASDEELEKNLVWSYENLLGDARATAAAGLIVLRAIRRFDKASKSLGIAMAAMTAVLVVLTAVLVWLTLKLVR
jgi:hypothetical protein